MEEDIDPVIIISKFNVKPQGTDQFLKASAASEIMRRQPGFISTQVHQGIGGSSILINYAVFESAESFKRASNHPDFLSRLSDYPSDTVVSPHLFKKLAVPGICVD